MSKASQSLPAKCFELLKPLLPTLEEPSKRKRISTAARREQDMWNTEQATLQARGVGTFVARWALRSQMCFISSGVQSTLCFSKHKLCTAPRHWQKHISQRSDHSPAFRAVSLCHPCLQEHTGSSVHVVEASRCRGSAHSSGRAHSWGAGGDVHQGETSTWSTPWWKVWVEHTALLRDGAGGHVRHKKRRKLTGRQ